jgi:hypothetical protein
MGLVQYPASSGATLKKQIFTSSGTFQLPSGFTADKPLWAKVTAVGGGGGGGQGYGAAGGGGGAVVVKDLAITGSIPIIVGSGGSSGGESTNGARGGDTIVGNSPTTPTNRVKNPFMTNTLGAWSTSGWSNATVGGSVSVFRSDYDSTTNQNLRNRHFICGDTGNTQDVFKSSYGVTIVSTSGDSAYEFLSDYFNLEENTFYYYGVYTRLSHSNNTVTVTLEWYDNANNLLNSSSPETFNYTSTGDGKYSDSGTSPVGTTKGRLRIRMRVANTNQMSQIFGCYVSSEVNHCPQYVQNGNTYWTGGAYEGYITRLNQIGLTAGTTGIIAGGGGGGMRATDEGIGGWAQQRIGGPGGHMGGFGTSHSNDSNGTSMIFGGDGGGAGGSAFREIFRGINNTTPFNTTDSQGFVGQNAGGIWRTFGWQMPVNSHYHRFGGNSGTSAFYLHSIDVNNFAKFRVQGAKPSVEGYSAGGPGRGYANFVNVENPSRYFYNEGFAHYRVLPYGNGGAATNGRQNRNTTNFGDIDYYVNGDWPQNGDPGIVILEWMDAN